MISLDLPLLLFDLAMRAVGPFVQAFPRKAETKQNKIEYRPQFSEPIIVEMKERIDVQSR